MEREKLLIMRHYPNLVFDVGSVLLSYRWMDMLREYGMSEKEAGDFAEMMFGDDLWLQFDLEIHSFEEVVDMYVKKNPSFEKEIRWFMDSRSSMMKGRPGVWDRIIRLKAGGYKIYILSNYSSVLFKDHVAIIPFMNDIDGKVVSHEIHKIKPYPEIYQELYRRYDLDPSECFFFDDRIANIEGAKATGMDGIVVQSEAHLEELLDEILAAYPKVTIKP